MHGLPSLMTVRDMQPADSARWDAYVEGHPQGSFFHLAGWRTVLGEGLGHRTFYALAERDGVLTGVLPLTQVRSRLFGNALISNAFCVSGGPLASDRESREALDSYAVSLAERLNVDYLEYRCPPPPDDAAGQAQAATGHGKPAWQVRGDLYAVFRRDIDPDPEVNMKAIPRKQRAMVRKGLKAGLVGETDEGVDRLHHIYAISVRNLGTPVFPKRYFRVLRQVFAGRSDILTVVHDGEAIASVLNFYFRDVVLPYYGGATLAARELAANDVMYWEVMRRAAERGYRLFDFGRSKAGTGAYAFKKHWGFEPEPLIYSYHLHRLSALPNLNPTNPKYRSMIALWRRLPLPVSKVLGPLLARNLG
ncbi:MAG: FemAB family PEP-CTERM system-associated protein [Alphaproteobacteria bacterium]|jgi:FemAB-related protein (PEP-CTERM system-associated)|nr:FemAB family PEP-CTERM system-associated protein [Alphaproteobacteria bacterium]